MHAAGNVGRRRRRQSTPEVDVLSAARMRGTVLPAGVRKRRLSCTGSEEDCSVRHQALVRVMNRPGALVCLRDAPRVQLFVSAGTGSGASIPPLRIMPKA